VAPFLLKALLMRARHWVWLGALLCGVSACGGKSTPSTDSGAASAGQREVPDESANTVAGSTSIAISPGGAGGSPVTPIPGTAGGPELSAAGGSPEVPDAGGTGVCTETLADVSKALGVECPAELCAGEQAASDCAALPGGVLRATHSACNGNPPGFEPTPALSYEFSGGRHKSCYYLGTVLAGVEVWNDVPSFCGGTQSHVRVGMAPTWLGGPAAGSPCAPLRSTTLCDVQNPVTGPSTSGNAPARACFDPSSASCQPCCDLSNGTPDCSVEPDGYPGFQCTPPGGSSWASCQCRFKQWSCVY